MNLIVEGTIMKQSIPYVLLVLFLCLLCVFTAYAQTDVAETTTNIAQGILARIAQIPESEVARGLLVLGGILLLLAGWLVYEFIIVLSGFFVGAAVALSLVPDANTLTVILLIIVGGLIGAVLSGLFYFVAVFLIGGYVGLVLTNTLVVALTNTLASDLVLIIGFVLGGVILLMFSFELLIVISSVVGAQMIARGLGLGVEWVFILALVGIVLQAVATRTQGYTMRRAPERRTWVRA
jgi:hypothetical protein